MKKFLFVLFGLFMIMGAFAAGENVPTSKSYVDAVVAQKQDKISASIIMPAGYTQLQYIESTGTQYIDTGYIPNQSSGVKTKVRFNSVDNNKATVFGSAQSYGSKAFELYLWNGRPEFNYGNGGDIFANNYMAIDDALELDWNKNIVNYSINNVEQQAINYPTGVSFVTPYTMYIFATHRPSGVTPGLVGIYYFKIYDNGTLVHDMVPARRDSDNVVGMYDTISGQFFTNSGTGEFVAGPVIVIGNQNQVLTNTGTAGEYGTKGIYDATGEYAAQTQNLVDAATMNAGVQNAIDSEFQCIEWLDPNDHSSDCLLMDVFGTTVNGGTTLPNGYTVLEYLASTGTQYIDTGVLLNGNSKIETKFSCSASGNYAVFGASNGNSYNSGEIAVFWKNNTLEIISPNSNSTSGLLGARPTINSGTPIELSYDKSFIKMDNFSYSSNWYTYYTGVNSMYIFGTHRTSSGPYVGNMKLYYLKIYHNNTLVRDFIPVIDPNGVPCMYDRVTEKFFYNAGTGDFIAGPVANMYLPAGN